MSTQLVLAPGFAFAALDETLAALGFRRDAAVQSFTAPMIANEPELAAWRRDDDAARLTYTFNPVVTLRVLATPDELRAELGARLPVVDDAALALLLDDGDPRRLLLGLFAARLVRPRRLRPAVARLRLHADPLVRRVAESALRELDPADGTTDVRALCQLAIPTLTALVGPDGAAAIAALRPRSDDFARVFAPEIAGAVAGVYAQLWLTTPHIERMPPSGWTLKIDGAPAAALSDDNEWSRPFPGGYRALASRLQPDRVWLVWRYVVGGHEAGVRYDGLVRLDDRWIWLPKPYRAVGEIVRGR
jgi:hypothetical protein